MRLLFITSTRIGDAVLSTGLLKHLLDRHPGARVTIVVGSAAAPLFEAVPGLERTITIKKRPFKGHWLGLWWAVAFRRWDVAVDLRASAITYLLPARRRLVVGPSDSKRHRVEELAGLAGSDPPPSPTIWTAPRHEEAARRLIPDGKPVLAIGPTANWPGKQWRAERFAELARVLTDPGGALAGGRVAVVAAPHERTQVQPVIDSIPEGRVIELIENADLPTVAACLRRCDLYVGNDSGLMHLAAAAGAPTLGLFGPSQELRYRPWGGHAAYVRTIEPYEELETRRAPPGEVQESLMDGLSVPAAVEAAEALLERLGRA